jgi:hypothetical protein
MTSSSGAVSICAPYSALSTNEGAFRQFDPSRRARKIHRAGTSPKEEHELRGAVDGDKALCEYHLSLQFVRISVSWRNGKQTIPVRYKGDPEKKVVPTAPASQGQ